MVLKFFFSKERNKANGLRELSERAYSTESVHWCVCVRTLSVAGYLSVHHFTVTEQQESLLGCNESSVTESCSFVHGGFSHSLAAMDGS